MSSVTRFIRQIQPETSLFSAAVVCTTPSAYAYEFVPAAGNVVGNYPAGTMTPASANSSALANAILAQVAGAGGIANVVLRDMGKTIRTNITGGSTVGFFRQVQLIAPTAATYIGGVGGNNFGVLGNVSVPDQYTPYVTFFVPIVAMGVSADAGHAVLHNAMHQ